MTKLQRIKGELELLGKKIDKGIDADRIGVWNFSVLHLIVEYLEEKEKEKEIADTADSAQATEPFVPRKKSLYDQLCAAINLIEEVWNGSAKDVSENIDIAYNYLVEVQNNWEEAIGQTDDH